MMPHGIFFFKFYKLNDFIFLFIYFCSPHTNFNKIHFISGKKKKKKKEHITVFL